MNFFLIRSQKLTETDRKVHRNLRSWLYMSPHFFSFEGSLDFFFLLREVSAPTGSHIPEPCSFRIPVEILHLSSSDFVLKLKPDFSKQFRREHQESLLVIIGRRDHGRWAGGSYLCKPGDGLCYHRRTVFILKKILFLSNPVDSFSEANSKLGVTSEYLLSFKK